MRIRTSGAATDARYDQSMQKTYTMIGLTYAWRDDFAEAILFQSPRGLKGNWLPEWPHHFI